MASRAELREAREARETQHEAREARQREALDLADLSPFESAMPTLDALVVGRRVRRYRARLGLSQHALAMTLELSAVAVDCIERGRFALTPTLLRSIAVSLALDTQMLCGPSQWEPLEVALQSTQSNITGDRMTTSIQDALVLYDEARSQVFRAVDRCLDLGMKNTGDTDSPSPLDLQMARMMLEVTQIMFRTACVVVDEAVYGVGI